MAVILEKDLERGRIAFGQWHDAAHEALESSRSSGNADPTAAIAIHPALPRSTWAMAVRYSLFLLERRAPGPGVEVRVAPWGAVKILDGPESDPHNLTPPDVIELDPDVWLRLACGITSWAQEKDAGHISAVGERDDLSGLLPLAR
nr:sterol carrier family protein [Bifidobacterium cebidarum]